MKSKQRVFVPVLVLSMLMSPLAMAVGAYCKSDADCMMRGETCLLTSAPTARPSGTCQVARTPTPTMTDTSLSTTSATTTTAGTSTTTTIVLSGDGPTPLAPLLSVPYANSKAIKCGGSMMAGSVLITDSNGVASAIQLQSKSSWFGNSGIRCRDVNKCSTTDMLWMFNYMATEGNSSSYDSACSQEIFTGFKILKGVWSVDNKITPVISVKMMTLAQGDVQMPSIKAKESIELTTLVKPPVSGDWQSRECPPYYIMTGLKVWEYEVVVASSTGSASTSKVERLILDMEPICQWAVTKKTIGN